MSKVLKVAVATALFSGIASAQYSPKPPESSDYIIEPGCPCQYYDVGDGAEFPWPPAFDNTDGSPKAEWEIMLGFINHYRVNGAACGGDDDAGEVIYMQPTYPVNWDWKLFQSAKEHAKELDEVGYCDHINRVEENSWVRVTRSKFPGIPLIENIMCGVVTNESAMWEFSLVVDEWIKDKDDRVTREHCQAIMSPDLTHIGVAKMGNVWVFEGGNCLDCPLYPVNPTKKE